MADSCRPSEIAATEISRMSKPKQNKPGQRAPKRDQALSLKSNQAPRMEPAQQPADREPIESAIASPAAVASPDAFSTAAVAPASTASIDFQTIAVAYSDYTRKSFEQTRSFVEKLAGVRSLDKAIEIQTEFAKQAYETFVTESQRIHGLYSGLAKQTFEGAVAKVIPAAR